MLSTVYNIIDTTIYNCKKKNQHSQKKENTLNNEKIQKETKTYIFIIFEQRISKHKFFLFII